MRLSPRPLPPPPRGSIKLSQPALDDDELGRDAARDDLMRASFVVAPSDSGGQSLVVDPSEKPAVDPTEAPAPAGFRLQPRSVSPVAQGPAGAAQTDQAPSSPGLKISPRINPAVPVYDQPSPDPSAVASADVPQPEHVVGDTGPAPYESAYNDFYADPETHNLDALKVAVRASEPVRNRNSRVKSILKSMLIAGGEMARAHPATTWQEAHEDHDHHD